MVDSPKWVKRKSERAKVGDKNGQATYGARKPPGPMDADLTKSNSNSKELKIQLSQIGCGIATGSLV